MDRQNYRKKDKETDIQMSRNGERETETETVTQSFSETVRLTDIQTGRQAKKEHRQKEL